jgi:hypothetical protein
MTLTEFDLTPENPRNQDVLKTGGAESGALPGPTAFARALAAVMSLPLSAADKADAVERLLRAERAREVRHN